MDQNLKGNGDQVLDKSTGAIHVAIPPRFSTGSQKLLNCLLYDYQKSQPDSEGINRVPIRDLDPFLGFNATKNSGQLWSYLTDLRDTHLEWDIFGRSGETGWPGQGGNKSAKKAAAPFLSYMEQGDGEIGYEINPRLPRGILGNPVACARFSLIIQSKFRGLSTLPLYEFFKNELAEANADSIQLEDIPIESLAWQLRRDQNGEVPDFYLSYRNLNRKVLKPCTAEINRDSDITITYWVSRYGKGRKVTALSFEITAKADFQLPLVGYDEAGVETITSPRSEIPADRQALYDQLGQLGIREPKLSGLVQQYPKEQIERAMRYYHQQRTLKGNSIQVGFLIRAIEQDYGAIEVAPSAAGAGEQWSLLNNPRTQALSEDALRKEWDRLRDEQIIPRFEAMSEANKKDLRERFIQSWEGQPGNEMILPKAREEFDRDGTFSSQFVWSNFRLFLYDTLAETAEERDFSAFAEARRLEGSSEEPHNAQAEGTATA